MTQTILLSEKLIRRGVVHGFTTRILGAFSQASTDLTESEPCVDILDGSGAAIGDALGEWEKQTGLKTEQLIRLNQVHGAKVLKVDRPASGYTVTEGLRFDAAISDRADVVLSVRTADCVPILLYSPAPRAIAAVHAGWRGTLAGCLKNAVDALCRHYGCRVAALVAAIGPCIQACCYQVGGDVADPFRKQFGPGVIVERAGERFVDLTAANRAWLERAGVLPENIETLALCTYCRPDLFFSYRRDSTGDFRQLAFISL